MSYFYKLTSKRLTNTLANVSFATPNTRATPLMLAANFGRVDVAQRLLDSGAKAASKDVFGRSALFYASRGGHSGVIKLLLEHKPAMNDGSLHEACREFHISIIDLLVKSGHDPNYRSTKHGGRTALGEMALKSRVPEDMSDAEAAIDILKSTGADPLVQTHGKSIIYQAMENTQHVAITQLLLDRILWQTINSDANMYRTADLHYSPTMYLTKAASHLSRASAAQIVTLLHDHGAKDIFYSTNTRSPQPPGAVGLPPAIAAAESRWLAQEAAIAEEEHLHQLALRREEEAHTRRAALVESSHAASIRHRHASAGLDIAIADASHDSATTRMLSAAAVQRDVNWTRHADEMAMSWEKAALGSHIAVNTAIVTRGINRDRYRDELAMESERRDIDIAYRARVHGMMLAERDEEERQDHSFREARAGQAARFDDGRHMRAMRCRGDEGSMMAERQQQMNAIDMSHRRDIRDSEIQHMHNRGQIQERNTRALNAADLDYRATYARGDLVYMQNRSDVGLGYARGLNGLEQQRHGMRILEQQGERMNIAGQVNLREWGVYKASQGQGQVGERYATGQGAVGWSG